LSSCEAEYIFGSFVACQAMWLVELLRGLKVSVKAPLELRIDNIYAINPVSHEKGKHIEIILHFLKRLGE